MTTIASFPDATYADSLHILELQAGDNCYNRRPKIKILNEWAAYAISGSSIFPKAVLKAIEAELALITETIINKGFANADDVATLVSMVQDESHILLILADSRWVVQNDTIVFIPDNSDVVLGSGGPHHNSLRYQLENESREVVLSKIVLLDDHTRGPWVRFRHSQLKSKVQE